MKTMILPIAVTLAAGMLAGDAPAPAKAVSPETLAMLDAFTAALARAPNNG